MYLFVQLKIPTLVRTTLYHPLLLKEEIQQHSKAVNQLKDAAVVSEEVQCDLSTALFISLDYALFSSLMNFLIRRVLS